MSRQEKINELIKAGQLYSFESWYAINKTVFELGLVKKSPKEYYEEYVREVLGE